VGKKKPPEGGFLLPINKLQGKGGRHPHDGPKPFTAGAFAVSIGPDTTKNTTTVNALR